MENFQTYGNVGSSSVNANQFSGVSTSLSRSFRSTRSASNSVISVRTSDQSYHSVGGGNQSSYLTPTGTGSFISMHGEVRSGIDATLMQKVDFTPTTYAKPGNPPIGQQDNTPVGDAVLPLLLIACAYVLVRMFRNRKKLQSVKN